VLGPEHPYSKGPGSAAEKAAQAILERRGSAPRLYRNTLVFLAADKAQLQDLDDAVRKYLAWESILNEKTELNLDPQQVKQAENQKTSTDSTVKIRIPETYRWLLVPAQATPQAAMEWQVIQLKGSDSLAVQASRRLRGDELLLTAFAASRLRMELDRVPLWRGDHVAIRELAEYFARYLYLPRLRDGDVLLQAIRDGLGLMTWAQDSFAFAESYDDAAGRYRGLRGGQKVVISDAQADGLLVKPDVALRQMQAEASVGALDANGRPLAGATAGGGVDGFGLSGGSAAGGVNGGVPADGTYPGGYPGTGRGEPTAPPAPRFTRFHGSVELDPNRVGRDAAKIAEEVIAHLAGQVHADVSVTLEIDAHLPDGVSDTILRIVTENCRSLKFKTQGFEED